MLLVINYVAEVLTDATSSYASDIWALGCIIFHLIVGRPPFKGSNEYQTFQKILNLQYIIPVSIIKAPYAAIISKLLVIDPLKRPSLSEIKHDLWFSDITWSKIHLEQVCIPDFLEPYIKDDNDDTLAIDFNFSVDDTDEDV